MADDTALKQYATILGYLQYENSVFWTRFQLFLVANAAFLGLLANNLPTSTASTWARLYTLAVPSGGGLFLCLLWMRIFTAVNVWIARWHSLLITLEPSAFDERKVFREIDHMENAHPVKKVAGRIIWLFLVLWILVLLYLAGVALAKVFHWTLV